MEIKIGTKVKVYNNIGIVTDIFSNPAVVNVRLLTGHDRGRILNYWLGNVKEIEPIKLKKFSAWK